MTQNISDLNPPRSLFVESTGTRRRLWLFLGAIGFGASVGYGAVALTGLRGAPAPAPDESLAAIGAQPAEEHEAEPSAVAKTEPVGEELIEAEDEIESPATPESEAEQGTFYVQVASYRVDGDAAEHAGTLAARGLPATSATDPANTAWHRVRLGPFRSRGDAEQARFELKLHEREAAYVVPRSNGKYHVQVGSFATREEAEPIARKMAARGHVTKISRVKMGEQRWHCVRIGPFDTADEAADYLSLVDLPGSKPVVIPYGPPQL